jgi:hypothetical protein
MNIPGLLPSTVSFVPLANMNAAIPVNPSEQLNMQHALGNLVPQNIINMPGGPMAGPGMPPVAPIPGMPLMGQVPVIKTEAPKKPEL